MVKKNEPLFTPYRFLCSNRTLRPIVFFNQRLEVMVKIIYIIAVLVAIFFTARFIGKMEQHFYYEGK